MDPMQRWLKLSFIFIIIITLLLGVVFTNRQALILHFVKPYLAPYNMTLSCSEIKLKPNLDIVIDKLCLNHDMFDITLKGGLVDWFYQRGITLKGVNLNSVEVKGLKKFKFKKSATAAKPLVQLHSRFKELSEFNLPFAININQFTYQTFNSKPVYTGSFLAADNEYKIHLSTALKTELVSMSLNIFNNKISGKVALNAQPSIEFLAANDIALPIEIQNNLNVKGEVNSEFTWQNNLLNVKQHSENLDVESEAGILHSGPFKLTHNAGWQAVINEKEVALVFDPQSKASFNFKHDTLIELLKDKQAPEYLIDLLNNNKKELIVIKPEGSLKVNFEQQSITVDTITFIEPQSEQSSLVKFEALTTSFNFEIFNTYFKISSQLNVSKEIIQDAISVNLVGKLNRNTDEFFIEFLPHSNIVIKNVKFDSVYILKVKTEFLGKVKLAPKTGLILDLNLESIVSKSILKNIIKTNQLVIKSKLDGSFENIAVSGSIVLDDINLANYLIQGDITQPYIDISMDQLSIPSLLALNIANKLDIALINGLLDYQLKGQLTDMKNALNNELDLSVDVKDVIGEVNGFWLEGFDWRQKFELNNQKITTHYIANNVKLGSIDVGTPISELIATSSINFESNQLNITLLNFKANAFDGSFNIPEFNWPIDAKKAVTLNLQQIDLSKIVELQKQQGIIVTGKVSGDLPLFIDDNIRIENGKLFNVGEGVIQIKDNPGVESLKQTSTELALAFDALENLHYHELNADVFMYDNGRMLLDTVIKGRNPDLDNDVNLNLNINYDLLGLIKSLRIADNVQSEIIQKLQQKD